MLDAAGLGDAPGDRARALFAAGADWIQLRDRTISDAALVALARMLVEACDKAERNGARIIVNKRADLARAAGAHGVHLGFDALDPASAREVLGASALLGRSLHSVDEVRERAAASDVDYVHLAPIWDPNSKPAERPALGVEAIREAAATGVPVIAQGGLDAPRAREAIAAGAAGVAVTGALARGGDPKAVLAPLRDCLDKPS